MEAENKQYANMHGDGQGQPTANTPLLQQQGQSQGYAPPYGQPTTPAPPYYAPPSGAGYGGGYGVTPSQQPQRQNQVIVVGHQQVVHVEPVESFVGAIYYSCFVIWCCGVGFIFGVIGFILASEYTVSQSPVVDRTSLVFSPRDAMLARYIYRPRSLFTNLW